MDNFNTDILNNVIMRYKSAAAPTTSRIKLPIEKVRDFLNSDMEEQGYLDAQSNSEDNNLKQKINELKAQGKQICKSAIEDYENNNIDIESDINIAKSAGFLDMVEKLKAQIEKNKKDIDRVKEIMKEDLLDDNMPVYASYRRGFEKWKRAISENLLTN